MNAQTIMTISAAVVALVQLFKWAGVPQRQGPILVLVAAALGVALWLVTAGAETISRANGFDYFAGWIAVATSAAGVFGFTRATGDAVSKMRTGGGGE